MTNKKAQKRSARLHPMLQKLLIYFAVPAFIYFIFFTIYSWPWMLHFNTHFFTDNGDGLQNVWNMWWVNKAVTNLHQLPWHTMYLHYPYGTTLIGQTLNAFNGFVGVVLLKVFSLAQAYNIMVIFSFVFGGLSMFWLCHYFTKKYIPSLLGGFIFTFSSYHFAHAVGHMQLVSLEWIPLFILLWWKLLKRPRYRNAIGAAVVLLLILLCDYYYFLYSVGLAGLILFYLLWRKQIPPIKEKQTWRPLLVFIIISIILVLPLPLALLSANHHDPLQGSHPGRIFSTDLLTPFIDGGFWRFHYLTDGYWHLIKAGPVEGTVYLTLSVLTLLIIAIWKRAKVHQDVVFWLGAAVIFGILSLGSHLMIFGYSINHSWLPYALLEKILPELKLSGVPVRMMVMTGFATAVISAMVLAKLDISKRRGQLLMAIFALVLVIELWPSALPNNPVGHPHYVDALSNLPATGGVLDNGAVSEAAQLYDQTIDEKPIPLGYISRTPLSVANKDAGFVKSLDIPEGYKNLCKDYKIRYYTTPIYRPLKGVDFPEVYKDNSTIIYDLKNSPNC